MPLAPIVKGRCNIEHLGAVDRRVTAARHAEASAFLTPADDNGSMKEAASPTSNVFDSAARVER